MKSQDDSNIKCGITWTKFLWIPLSGCLAFVIASLEYHDYLNLGLSNLRNTGWPSLVLLVCIATIALGARYNVKYVILATFLQALSLAVDRLPLLGFGKAELALALVVFSQWMIIHIQGERFLGRTVVALCLANGCLVQALYFLAALNNKNYVGIF